MSVTAELEKGFSGFSHAYGQPKCEAVLKQEFTDFQVEEIIGFDFTGTGKHLCLQIQKTDQTTIEVAKAIAQSFKVKLSDVGYAGMKDRRGICTQWFSVPHNSSNKVDTAKLENENTKVLEVRCNDRKIRRGSHRSNAFKICLQQFRGAESELEARISKIETHGVPNYFGPQRFGKDMRNVTRAVDYFLSLASAQKKPRRDRIQISMMLSATRSFLFNQILSHRVENNSWAQILQGEVMGLDGTSRFFVPGIDLAMNRDGKDNQVTQELSQDQQLQKRLADLDIHPSGLLFGRTKASARYQTSGAVEVLESEVVSRYPELCKGLLDLKVDSGRRALRLIPRNLKFKLIDSNKVELEFSLPKGGYATVVLRELCVTKEPGIT